MESVTLTRPRIALAIIALVCLAGTSCSSGNSAADRPDTQSSTGSASETKTTSVAIIQDNSTALGPNDWAGFLGTDGSARSADTVPQVWSDTENLFWKKDLPGKGTSSPIIVGHRLLLTCHVVDGGKGKRQVLCFDKNDGSQLWSADYPIEYQEDKFQGYITEHGYSSNTPVSDGENVYVFFGKGGVHCLSLTGEKKWSFDAGKGSSRKGWGSAASLVLYKNLVIVNAAEESKALIALNKTTGEEAWRQDADLIELTYGTPRIVPLDSGEEELIISVPSEVWGMNPTTGKLKWFASSPTGGNVSPSTIVNGNTVYSFGGYQQTGSVAVTIGGKDDVTDSNVLWTSRSKDGTSIYRERVKGIKGGGRPVYASPVLIGDKIYVTTRKSGTYVYAPGEKFDPISQNVFASDDSDFNASPAVSEGRIYIRSDQAIYCVAKQ